MFNPERLLIKLPVPVPLTVLVVNAIVGFWFVLQTTPLAEIVAPPSFVTLPPDVAVVPEIKLKTVVVTVGNVVDKVVTIIWFP